LNEGIYTGSGTAYTEGSVIRIIVSANVYQGLYEPWFFLPEGFLLVKSAVQSRPIYKNTGDNSVASKDEIITFLKKDFPQNKCIVESVGEKFSRIKWPVSHEDLRPGGTVSGPSLMTAADVALYVAILGEIGIVPLAVTTNLNISFLRKPAPDKDLIAECRLIKLGRTLAMGDVFIYSEGSEQAVAHAVGTYAIPALGQSS